MRTYLRARYLSISFAVIYALIRFREGEALSEWVEQGQPFCEIGAHSQRDDRLFLTLIYTWAIAWYDGHFVLLSHLL